jgi:hypothetical protein
MLLSSGSCCRVIWVLSVVLALNAAALSQTPQADAQRAHADGDYREALRHIAQAMSSGQLSVEQRYSLLMLRGDTLLRLGERMLASNTFNQAANLHPDVRETALARAMAELARRSPNNQYRPETGPTLEPIDIVSPDSRPQAFAALFADTLASLRPRVRAALRADTLPPTIALIQPVIDMGAMEYQATGAADETRQILTELGDHARVLMSREIRRLGFRVGHLMDLSHSIQDSSWGFSRRGLQFPEERELRELAAELRQIAEVAQESRTRARELGFDGSAWESIICDAFDLAHRAEAVLGSGRR